MRKSTERKEDETSIGIPPKGYRLTWIEIVSCSLKSRTWRPHVTTIEAMDTGTLVSVEEYLRTSYPDGDREYVDGQIVERNVGEVDHSDVQTAIATYVRYKYKNLWVGVEVRVQVRTTRFRVPDISIIEGKKPKDRTVQVAPHVVVEVLSPVDRADELEEKIGDYLGFGIRYVWVVNPRTRRGSIYISEGMREAKDGILRAHSPDIEVPLAEVFD
jgi:Uma2 family endonuclease